eukprot:scaffold77809_cov17-Tisochrysis_lutea.AAC.4
MEATMSKGNVGFQAVLAFWSGNASQPPPLLPQHFRQTHNSAALRRVLIAPAKRQAGHGQPPLLCTCALLLHTSLQARQQHIPERHPDSKMSNLMGADLQSYTKQPPLHLPTMDSLLLSSLAFPN